MLRLHHARRHADVVGGLWRDDRSLSEIRRDGAEARSGAPCGPDRRGDDPSRRRRDFVDARLSAVSAGRASARRSTHIAKGRFGWNIVTSGEDTAAQNFGLDELPPRELRYEMADEYLALVNQLFDSWEPGAMLVDRESDTYADHTKVKPIHFKGKFFASRGTAQHGALAAGTADLCAGRRLADRTCLRGASRRFHHRCRQRDRGHEVLSRRRAGPRQGFRAQPRRHQSAVPGGARSRRHRGRSKGQIRAHAVVARLHQARARAVRLLHRHRFFAVRARFAAAETDDQRRTGVTRQISAMGQRQDPAAARARWGAPRVPSS